MALEAFMMFFGNAGNRTRGSRIQKRERFLCAPVSKVAINKRDHTPCIADALQAHSFDFFSTRQLAVPII